MPSKKKSDSNSKSRSGSGSKPEYNQRSPSSSANRAPSKADIESSLSPEEVGNFVKEAAARFPTLIGEAAVVGRVSGPEKQSNKCEVWLSKSSFDTYNLRPGTSVSVSLAQLSGRSFPLCSLTDECARSYGFDSDSMVADTVGSYFVIAELNFSTQAKNNDVILSSKLSYSMGFPASGRTLFVFPIQDSSADVLKNAHEECRSGDKSFRICKCKEMYLELVHSKDSMRANSDYPSTSSACNGFSSSPRTPSNQTFHKSGPAMADKRNPSLFDVWDIHNLLDSASVKSLVQTWVTSCLSSRILLCGNIVDIQFSDKKFFFSLVRANGLTGHISEAFLVDRETEVYLQLPSTELSRSSYDGNALFLGHEGDIIEEDVDKVKSGPKLGGLSKEYAILKGVLVPSSAETTVSCLGLRTNKGILLHGPPGTGKTSLVQQCAYDAGVKLFTVRGPEFVSQFLGESENALQNIFDSASRALPAMVFIDELDAIAPAREYGGDGLSLRIGATLLKIMDGINRNSGLCVVAATNRLETVDPALRRPGRFGREIEIGVPSPVQRAQILHQLLEGIENSLTDSQVWQLAANTHGYVGADLASLCDEAALVCLKRSCCVTRLSLDNKKLKSFKYTLDDAIEESESGDSECFSCSDNHGSSGTELNSKKKAVMNGDNHCQDGFVDDNRTSTKKDCMLKVALEDFEKARIKVRPSAMREVILEVPKVSWEDVGGQEEVKTQLMEAVLWPQKHQDAFIRIGTCPPTGILLFGPPGCSKTLLARAVASQARLNFLAVKGPELFSKWVGESEKAVKSLFAKARANAPAIIFFDEIDGLAVIRGKESDGVSVSDRVMSQLLVELDGLHERVNVIVIAATNRPDKIDSALLRPGRFDRLLYVGPPNELDREAIFRIHLKKTPLASDVNIKELAALTEGYTGADISLVCREAGFSVLEENIDASSISMSHFRSAINQVTPLETQSYKNLSARFQRLVDSSYR